MKASNKSNTTKDKSKAKTSSSSKKTKKATKEAPREHSGLHAAVEDSLLLDIERFGGFDSQFFSLDAVLKAKPDIYGGNHTKIRNRVNYLKKHPDTYKKVLTYYNIKNRLHQELIKKGASFTQYRDEEYSANSRDSSSSAEEQDEEEEEEEEFRDEEEEEEEDEEEEDLGTAFDNLEVNSEPSPFCSPSRAKDIPPTGLAYFKKIKADCVARRVQVSSPSPSTPAKRNFPSSPRIPRSTRASSSPAAVKFSSPPSIKRFPKASPASSLFVMQDHTMAATASKSSILDLIRNSDIEALKEHIPLQVCTNHRVVFVCFNFNMLTVLFFVFADCVCIRCIHRTEFYGRSNGSRVRQSFSDCW